MERSIECNDVVVHIDKFRAISQAQLEQILDNISSKTGLMGLIPIKYLKSIPHCWIEAMLLTVNSSMEEFIFHPD